MSAKRNRPRQGRKHRKLGIQPLEARRVLAASVGWDGPGLGSAELTYFIANSPDSLTQAETNAAIETALQAWSDVADVNFTPTTQRGLTDSLDISFENIDGGGGTLAQAYLPDDVNPARIAGDIQFDLAEVWEVGNSLGSRAFDLVWVAAHEIGHALGLDHHEGAGSVLAPFVSPNQSFTGLGAEDVEEIQELYAARDSATVETGNEEPTIAEIPVDTGDSNDETDRFQRRRWFRFAFRGWGFAWRGVGFSERLGAGVPERHNLYNPTDVNGDQQTSALDALMVINHLAGSESSAMCDTNGDGSVTAIDALTVINAMGEATDGVVDDNVQDTDEGPSDEQADEDIDESDDQVDDDSSADEDTEGPLDQADDDDVEVDDEDDQEADEEEMDDEDSDDHQDDGDTDDDDTDEGEPIDDGGLIDEGDEEDEDDHDDGHHRGRHRHHRYGLAAKSADAILARFDGNQDGELSEDEVPGYLWNKFINREVDADSGGTISEDELTAAITAARQDRFTALDEDGDGLITESEVSARLWNKILGSDGNDDATVSFEEFDSWLQDRAESTDRQDHHRRVDRAFAQFARRTGFARRRF